MKLARNPATQDCKEWRPPQNPGSSLEEEVPDFHDDHALAVQAVHQVALASANIQVEVGDGVGDEELASSKVDIDNTLKTAFGFTFKTICVYVTIRAIMPVLCNAAWVAAANMGGCGGGLQSFWTFLFEYDFYFMLLKALMISMYFLCFMPDPSPSNPAYTNPLHLLLVVFMVIFNAGLGLLWWALDLHNKELLTWLLFKINFPTAATLSFVAWAPFYLLLNYARSDRLFAFKRYVLLVIVLVCDVIFIATSLAYVWVYVYVTKNIVPHHSWFERQAIQCSLVVGFTLCYMPALGKIWQLGIFLVDRIAPMQDLQRQRFIFFATVICDMHRVLYCRELFVNLESMYVFYLFLAKDFMYLMYQFVVKATPEYQANYVRMFHRADDLQRLSALTQFAIAVVRSVARMFEAPKTIMAWANMDIDAGFRQEDECYVQDTYFYCADFRIKIHNLPSITKGKFATILEKPKEDQNDEITSCVRKATSQVEAESYRSQRSVDSEELRKHSWFDTCTASNLAVAQLEDLKQKGLELDPARQLIKYLQFRLNSIIFIRAQGRLTISLATAFSHLFMHLVIRASPSKDILNSIHDHTETLQLNVVIVSLSFVLFDLAAMLVIFRVHFKRLGERLLNVARFGRLFVSNDFFIMVLLCTICCNSDFFLTYPLMKFCQ